MQTRRQIFKNSALVASQLLATDLFAQNALAFDKSDFEAKSVAEVLKALGVGVPVESNDVTIDGPKFAENGAVVPFTVGTTLAGVKQMLILVEKNPSVLVARFKVTERVEANFAIRVKMEQTSDVYVVA
jgi:sulfur-oxidizing protein SoxY